MANYTKYLANEYSFNSEGEKVNCAVLAYRVLTNEFDLEVPGFDYDGDEKRASKAILAYVDNWQEVEPKTIGSLVIIHIGDHVHCGVVISDTHFIHCLKGRNTTIEPLDSLQWRSRIQGYYVWQP